MLLAAADAPKIAAKTAVEAATDTGLSISFEPLMHDGGIPLAVMGMMVVFLALITISTFISQLPWIMARIEGVAATPKPAAKPAKKKKTAAAEDPDELIAVLAAAVEATLGPGARIIRTSELSSRDLAWTHQGRWQHQTSHSPRSK